MGLSFETFKLYEVLDDESQVSERDDLRFFKAIVGAGSLSEEQLNSYREDDDLQSTLTRYVEAESSSIQRWAAASLLRMRAPDAIKTAKNIHRRLSLEEKQDRSYPDLEDLILSESIRLSESIAEKGYIACLSEALQTEEFDIIMETIRAVDRELTGDDVMGANINLPLLRKFLSDLKDEREASALFHLSDHGFSQLSIWLKRDGTSKIEISYNASLHVKEQWALKK